LWRRNGAATDERLELAPKTFDVLGWNRLEAAKCEEALKRLKERGDSITIAHAQISFSMVCMVWFQAAINRLGLVTRPLALRG
jgi:hypothetical protein